MARKFQVEQAIRTKVYPKIGIFGPSGSGKTYTALRLATGMIEELEKIIGEKKEIWLANNEGGRGKYYANEFNYKIIELSPPHEPELYYDLIEYAEQNKECGVLIVDSLSKEWAGPGGCLEIANSFKTPFHDGWKIVSPRHRRLMDKLVDSNLIIIATMRGEDQYILETTPDGKSKPVKIGIGAKQGKDFEYEFTCTFNLDQKTNCAEMFKDNTHLFENRPPLKLTEQDGINIIRWAYQSDIEPTKPVNEIEQKIKQIDETIERLMKINESTGKPAYEKEKIVEIIKSNLTINGKPSANYRLIKDVETANKIYEILNNLEVKVE